MHQMKHGKLFYAFICFDIDCFDSSCSLRFYLSLSFVHIIRIHTERRQTVVVLVQLLLKTRKTAPLCLAWLKCQNGNFAKFKIYIFAIKQNVVEMAIKIANLICLARSDEKEIEIQNESIQFCYFLFSFSLSLNWSKFIYVVIA